MPAVARYGEAEGTGRAARAGPALRPRAGAWFEEEPTMALLDPGTWTGKIFTGGWAAADGGVLEVVEPATGTALGTLGQASARDVAASAAAAADAQRDWAARTYEDRAAVLRRAGRLFEEHAGDRKSVV